MTRWFRFYDEVLDDPKVQKLPCDDFRAWVNILCLASRNEGRLPPEDSIAFALRIDVHAVATLLSRLVHGGLLDRLQGGPHGWHYAPHGWEKRQYKSDTSTERVKRFRKRSETVSETPPDTDTDTDTEQKEEANASCASGASKDFEAWWQLYPNKVGKKAVRPKYLAAHKQVGWAVLDEGLRRYIATKPPDRQWCNPATWLNQGRWADEGVKSTVVSLIPDYKLISITRSDIAARACINRWRAEHENRDPKGDETHVWVPEPWVTFFRNHLSKGTAA